MSCAEKNKKKRRERAHEMERQEERQRASARARVQTMRYLYRIDTHSASFSSSACLRVICVITNVTRVNAYIHTRKITRVPCFVYWCVLCLIYSTRSYVPVSKLNGIFLHGLWR